MQLSANGIALEVEDHGPAYAEPLLLIMGWGMQLVAWPDGLVKRLVGQGYRVIRFDNRDIGLSQSFDHLGMPHLAMSALKSAVGLNVHSTYTLSDMANDAAGVLHALGLPRAHICGASMGGMIAQHLAVQHPTRVKSLTLMMTTSGAHHLPGPSLKMRLAMVTPPADPHSTQGLVAHAARIFRLMGSPGYPTDEAPLRAQVEWAIKRSYRPQATARQLMAIAADGDRSPLLAQITAPTHIIHGQDDPLVPVAAAHDLAHKIAGATLDVVPGMGHDLPEPLWPRFVAGIDSAASRAA